MLETCLATAAEERKSLAEMSALDSPSAMSSRTSRSRGESSRSHGALVCISELATSGSMTTPPPATVSHVAMKSATSATRSLRR